MAKEPQVKGVVTEVLPDQLFRVKLADDGREIVCYLLQPQDQSHSLSGRRQCFLGFISGRSKRRIVYRG